MNLKAVVHPEAEGGYWAEVPSLPGCVTQGEKMHPDTMEPTFFQPTQWKTQIAMPGTKTESCR